MIKVNGYTSSDITHITNILNKYLSFGLCTEDKVRAYIADNDYTLATTEVDGDIASILVAKTFNSNNMNSELKSLSYSQEDIEFFRSLIEGEQILTTTHAVTLPEYEGLNLVTNMVDYVMKTKNISESVSLAWINKEGLDKRLEEKYKATKLIKHYWEKDNYQCNICKSKCMCDAMLIYNKIELTNNTYAIDFRFDGQHLTKHLAEWLVHKEFPENISNVDALEKKLFRLFNKTYLKYKFEDIYDHVVQKDLLVNDIEDINDDIALVAYVYDQMGRQVTINDIALTDFAVIEMTEEEIHKTVISIWIKILNDIVELGDVTNLGNISEEMINAIKSLKGNRTSVSKIIYCATVNTLANQVYALKGLPSTFNVPAIVTSDELLRIIEK